jgi:uncharacterized protein YqeY
MPAQMTQEEIESAVKEIIEGFGNTVPNKNALIGKTMGMFNKNYQGKADLKIVSSVINKFIE